MLYKKIFHLVVKRLSLVFFNLVNFSDEACRLKHPFSCLSQHHGDLASGGKPKMNLRLNERNAVYILANIMVLWVVV